MNHSNRPRAQLGIMTGDEVTQHARELAQKLKVPEHRKVIHEKQRAAVIRMYPDVGRVLALNAALELRLIDLLVDEQMARLDERYGSDQSQTHDEKIQQRADAYTRQMDRVRALLGVEGPLRLLDYQLTTLDRASLLHFEERLSEHDKLSENVRAQVIEFLRAERESQVARARARARLRGISTFEMHEPGGLARVIARENYDALQDMPRASARLLAQLEPMLSPPQFAVYADMETAKLAAQQRFVDELLADAGLDKSALSRAGDTIPQIHKPAAGPLRFDLDVQVNGVAGKIANLLTANGDVAEVQLMDGLTLELVPTLLENGWLDVKTRFIEGSSTWRRVPSTGPGSGHAMRHREGAMREVDIVRTVVEGTRGYAVFVKMINIHHPVLDSPG
jgi:hypothetical protein